MGNAVCCGCNEADTKYVRLNTIAQEQVEQQKYAYHSNKHRSDNSQPKINHNNSEAFDRLQKALQYFESLDLQNNSSNIDEFMQFCDETYTQTLNDYIYVISTYGNELDGINSRLSTCNQSHCSSFNRFHNRNFRQSPNTHHNDHRLQFYITIYDNIHNWLFHLYHTGMRTRKDADDDNNDEENSEEGDKYFDHRIARIRRRISDRRNKLRKDGVSISRYESSSKYHLTMNATINDSSDNAVFTDTMLIHLQRETPDRLAGTTDDLYEFLRWHDYDTDAIVQDIEDENESNITRKISNETYTKSLIEYVRNSRGMCYICTYYVSQLTMLCYCRICR